MGEDQSLERLREILARPEYQIDQSVPWWQQLFGPLLDLIGYLLAHFIQTVVDSASGREGWLGLVALGTSGVVFAIAAVYLLHALRLGVTRDTRVASASLSQRRDRSERLWQSAQQLAAAGELAEAVRLLYLSALYALDERAVLHVESGLTNREHARRLLNVDPMLAQTFGEIVERYDHVRYGVLPVTDAAFGELREMVARSRAASFGRRSL